MSEVSHYPPSSHMTDGNGFFCAEKCQLSHCREIFTLCLKSAEENGVSLLNTAKGLTLRFHLKSRCAQLKGM